MILLGGYLKNYEMIFQSAKFYGAANLILNKNLDYIYLSASWSHGADDIFHSYHSALSHIHPQEFNLSRHLVTNENIKNYPGMNAYEYMQWDHLSCTQIRILKKIMELNFEEPICRFTV